MRVLLVGEQLRRKVPGGIGTYTRGLISGFAALGPDGPDLALWASRAPGAEATDPLAALARVVVSPLPGPVLVRAWDRGWVRPPDGFDVVHSPSLAHPPPGRAPMAVTVHDLAWRRDPSWFPPRGRRWHEAALKRAMATADLLVVPSLQTADDLIAAGAAASRVEVVEEGSDHLPPPDDETAAALLDRLGVAGPFLLTVSTLEPRKNLPRLLAAYRSARPRLGDQWPLLVVGPPGWGPELVAEPGVVLAGAVPGGTLAGLYHRSRLVVSVPLHEGYGLPALEAMAAGIPVVASPMPSVGEAALLTDPHDVARMAEDLTRAANDDGLRSDLVAAGLTRARERTWAATAARHAELWKRVSRPAGGRVAP